MTDEKQKLLSEIAEQAQEAGLYEVKEKLISEWAIEHAWELLPSYVDRSGPLTSQQVTKHMSFSDGAKRAWDYQQKKIDEANRWWAERWRRHVDFKLRDEKAAWEIHEEMDARADEVMKK